MYNNKIKELKELVNKKDTLNVYNKLLELINLIEEDFIKDCKEIELNNKYNYSMNIYTKLRTICDEIENDCNVDNINKTLDELDK